MLNRASQKPKAQRKMCGAPKWCAEVPKSALKVVIMRVVKIRYQLRKATLLTYILNSLHTQFLKGEGPQTLTVTSVKKGLKRQTFCHKFYANRLSAFEDIVFCTFHNSFLWRLPFCQSCHVTK